MSCYVWIVGGSVMQEPMLNEIHHRGLCVILSDGNNDCYLKSKLLDTDVFYWLDTYDTKAHKQQANLLYELGSINVCGVVAPGIDVGPTVSAIAEVFSLPGVSQEVAECVRNKSMMRILTSFEHPGFLTVFANVEENFRRWTRFYDLPCIIKPVDNCGTRGISVATNKQEFLDGVTLALRSNKVGTGALIEEMLSGSEYALDFLIIDRKAVWVNGCIRLFRHHIPGTREPLFGIEGLVINPFVAPKELCDLATTAARRLGVTSGPFKVDALLDKQYGWTILECTTRWSGGWDHMFLAPMIGRDVTSVLLDYALGLEPVIPPVLPNRYSASYTPYYAPMQKCKWVRVPATKDISWEYNIRSPNEILPLKTCADRPIFFRATGKSPLDAAKNVIECSKFVVPQDI